MGGSFFDGSYDWSDMVSRGSVRVGNTFLSESRMTGLKDWQGFDTGKTGK